MDRLTASPIRNLTSIVAFVAAIVVLSTFGYMRAGWSFEDAIYMVVITVFTVGYQEVRPIDTPYLHMLTLGTVVLGCTGMILVTGAMVQVFTSLQIKELLGINRVKTDIDKLKDHVIVCGFGRIGVMLAKELTAGGASFVVLERAEQALPEDVLELGYLCLQGDATDEDALIAAGVQRARVLATVLPDDATNVFITLSARSLNPNLHIIARGEVPSTESKLIQAGADQVVLPTHIGAERIAEMILYPETARFIRGSDRMRDFEKVLRDLGMELEMVVAAEHSAAAGATVEELERRGQGAFFVVQIDRQGGETITRPPGSTRIVAGDGLLVVGRNVGGALERGDGGHAQSRVLAGRSRLRPGSTTRRSSAGRARSLADRLSISSRVGELEAGLRQQIAPDLAHRRLHLRVQRRAVGVMAEHQVGLRRQVGHLEALRRWRVGCDRHAGDVAKTAILALGRDADAEAGVVADLALQGKPRQQFRPERRDFVAARFVDQLAGAGDAQGRFGDGRRAHGQARGDERRRSWRRSPVVCAAGVRADSGRG